MDINIRAVLVVVVIVVYVVVVMVVVVVVVVEVVVVGDGGAGVVVCDGCAKLGLAGCVRETLLNLANGTKRSSTVGGRWCDCCRCCAVVYACSPNTEGG